jgi:hypothetical protein
MTNCWIIKKGNKEICLEDPPENVYGYIYLITGNGKIYVGKKAFQHKTKARLSVKAKKLPENKGKRIVRGVKDSGWKDYYGSSKDLTLDIKKLGKDKFKREVLSFAKNKSELTLQEIEYQVKFNVLRVPSYNNWIGGKVFRKNL